MNAFSLGFPKFAPVHLVCLGLLYVVFGIYKILWRLFGGVDLIDAIRRDLNDERIFRKEARRLYVFSRGDEMVRWSDVEDHVEEARRRGFGGDGGVGMVRFGETPHCGHLMGEENRTRYVRALEGAWEGRSNV